ncbi:hypothetical protein HanHA300_Chr17g0640941 [Helianthus annuus]|nr:hypothetical protein HanHA300_Chr17g0640941 [Helianthus annuus]KAJ0446273.1 hypothetical protein HanHA89_Chr17g0692531 [Helianthus annuus]
MYLTMLLVYIAYPIDHPSEAESEGQKKSKVKLHLRKINRMLLERNRQRRKSLILTPRVLRIMSLRKRLNGPNARLNKSLISVHLLSLFMNKLCSKVSLKKSLIPVLLLPLLNDNNHYPNVRLKKRVISVHLLPLLKNKPH